MLPTNMLVEVGIQWSTVGILVHISTAILCLFDFGRKLDKRYPGLLSAWEATLPIYVVLFYILSRLPS